MMDGLTDKKDVESTAEDGTQSGENYTRGAAWIGVGVALGAGIGAAMGNVAIGVAIGIAIGVALGAARGAR